MTIAINSELSYSALVAYHEFENDVRLALKSQSDEGLRRGIQSAISRLELTFCPQQKENRNAS
jgi:hypothetical protein